MRKTGIIGLAAILLLAIAPASAGTRAAYTKPGEPTLVIEVADNGAIRVGPEGQDRYGLLIGEDFYLAGAEDGVVRVMRVQDLAAAFDKVLPPMFKSLFGAGAKSSTTSGAVKIEKIGPRSVGGRAGIAYRISSTGGKADDAQQPAEIVISEDPALAPVGRALGRFFEAGMMMMAPMMGEMAADMVGESRAVAALGTPLATADGMTLAKVETLAIPAERVTLPGKPMTVDEIIKTLKITPTTGQ